MTAPNSFDLLTRAAAFGERRQLVLAENIAHLDTPDYKTRDLDVAGFRAALREAVAASRNPSETAAKTPFTPELSRPRVVEPSHVLFQDGNNRRVEREVAELAKNLLQHQFAVELLSSQTALLQAVISERP